MGLLGKVFTSMLDSSLATKEAVDRKIANLMDQKRRASDPDVKSDIQKRIDNLRVKKRYMK